MNYIIGIDAGGTKSELIAYDLNNNIIFNKIGGFGNPAVNLDKTINNIITLIGECTSELNKENCKLIAIGMAAVETGNYAELIKKYVEGTYNIKTVVLNDAEMAYKSYLKEEDGMLVIAGTGSSCYVKKDKQGEMVGGWSHILGDEGSAYHTVIQLFKSIVNKIDNNLALDSLSKEILNEIGGYSRSEIMEFIYHNEKNIIASLYPIIVNYSLKNDASANSLLQEAAKSLVKLTLTAYEKKEFKGFVTIGLKGGVFHNKSNLKSIYIEELSKHISNFKIIQDDISTTKAVISLYKD